MRATEFEFRYRFWIITAIFFAAFWCYRFDHTNASAALLRLFGVHSLELDLITDRHLIQCAFAVAGLICILGAALRTWGAAYLRSDVVHDSSLRLEGVVADGPYRYVRNPLYLGGILLAIGFGLLASRIGFVVAVVGMTLFTYRLIRREEAALLETHGEAYRRFLNAVPRLVPSLRPRLPSGGLKPQWGQALRGEAAMWVITLSVEAYAASFKPIIMYVMLGGGLAFAAMGRAVYHRGGKERQGNG